MTPSVTCYTLRVKRRGRRLCDAFAAGSGGQVRLDARALAPGPAAFYGVPLRLKPLFDAARGDGRTWFYMDNGYFGRGRYFRATRNALQNDGRGAGDTRRLHELGIEIRPWRRAGSHVLVCPPGELFGRVMGFDARAWLETTLATLKRHSDRPIIVRRKPLPGARAQGPLALDLRNCWALVTRTSNAAVEALCAGVPVFATDPCAASAMGLADLSRIEAPVTPEGREAWAACLAANQWTLEEIRSGVCWRALNGLG